MSFECHKSSSHGSQEDVSDICQENRVAELLNMLDQLSVEDKILRSLGIEDMVADTSPYAQVQQASMEIKRQELRWLQNTLKEEVKAGELLREQASHKQHELSSILEKLNQLSHSFTEGTIGLRAQVQGDNGDTGDARMEQPALL